MEKDLKPDNVWNTNLQGVFDFIQTATGDNPDGWQWFKNSECKYIELRIDMRDGGFILKNGEGERISLERLKYQGEKHDF